MRHAADQTPNNLRRCRGTTAVGVKRSLESTEAELADVSWRQLLGYDAAQESTLNSERLKRVCVIGAGKLGCSLAESLVSKPGLAQVAVNMSIGGKEAKFDIMPGMSVIQGAKDACAWADFIFFCCSYAECRHFLLHAGVRKAIKGKSAVLLASGTPEDANNMSQALALLGANYLDAFVLSEGTPHVFNHRLSSMMVSGDKYAWKDVEEIVRAIAPASFYGGHKGLRQAKNIGRKFGLPGNVLPQILSGGYLPMIQELVRNQTEGSAGVSATSLPSQPARSSHVASRSSLQQEFATQPGVGSAQWRQQLERIRDVCRSAAVDHSIIDGFLASECPELRQSGQSVAILQHMTASGASEHRPSMRVDAVDFESALNSVCHDGMEGFSNMDTDLTDGMLTAAWAP